MVLYNDAHFAIICNAEDLAYFNDFILECECYEIESLFKFLFDEALLFFLFVQMCAKNAMIYGKKCNLQTLYFCV